MSQTCSHCSRINPDDAAYCYFDGTPLPDHHTNGASRSRKDAVFSEPFIFPNGRAVLNFDELALGCQADWDTARNLLIAGRFEEFLHDLGREDLALAAREDAYFPDPDRGLDRFLARLPTQVLEGPNLQVNPNEINLGEIPVGEDRGFEIHLENKGMRFIHGLAECDDCPWLSLGGSMGGCRRLIEFQAEAQLPIQVVGRFLHAGERPLEARVKFETNGGTKEVKIRVQVPIVPFAEGVLAGARTPRQLAEKTRAAPREALVFFADGSVIRWYEWNGWKYPIIGPSAQGLALIQQYFEALGLTPPPRVEVDQQEIVLKGRPGRKIRHGLEVLTDENRPVYAFVESDQRWLKPGKPVYRGRRVRIPLRISCPAHPKAESLAATLSIRSNGNQTFQVPLIVRFPRRPPSSRNEEIRPSRGWRGFSWLMNMWKRPGKESGPKESE